MNFLAGTSVTLAWRSFNATYGKISQKNTFKSGQGFLTLALIGIWDR